MPHTIRDGLELHYEIKGDGPPLLLLSGTLSSRQVWGLVARRLKGFKIVLMDNRDSGLSTLALSDYSILDLAKDAFAILDHAGIPAAHLAGHSMGGAVAQEMALLHPERVLSLTLISTWAKTDVYSGSGMRLFALLRARLTDDREFLHANTLIVNAASQLQFMAMEDVGEWILHYGNLQPADAYQRNVRASQPHDTLHRLPSIQCPTLVIWGDEDKVFPHWHARQLIDTIPGAKELHLKGVGHMAILQAADKVSAAIAAHITA
jgi:pimeloyl-ACP methyl ester carboxylesterase